VFFVAAVLILMFFSVTLLRREAWPFTRYPMFSHYRDPRDVCVICIALENSDGNLTWWRPHFYRYPDILGRKLVPDDPSLRLKYVSEVLRLVRLEKGATDSYRAIHILERRWIDCSAQDRTLARVTVNGNASAM
jgi:hypothetical protein